MLAEFLFNHTSGLLHKTPPSNPIFDWFKWTYWISPELGHRVAFEKKDKTYVTGSYMLEFVKAVNP